MAGTQPTGRMLDADFALLDLIPQAAFAIAIDDDDSFRFVYANPRYCALLGITDDAVLDGDLRTVLPTDALVPHVRQLARAAKEHVTVRFDVDLGTSSRQTVAVEVAPVVDGRGRCRTLLGVAHDVTEHKWVEAQLAHRTRHDPLTELPNRVFLRERLSDALERSGASGRRVGLVLLDLDHFNVVNDSLGHDAGDELLGVVARRVDGVLRAGDIVARMGGDELAIICNGVRGTDDVLAVARRVRATFDTPISLDGNDVVLSASLGVVLSNGPDDVPARMLRDAEVATFAAKELGRGRVELFDDRMRDGTVARLELGAGLRRALLRRELRVHYQPVVRLDRSEVVGFEALVRWDHPEHGLVPLPEFLPVGGETGLVVAIGGWALTETCRQAAGWCADTPDQERLAVAVHLSAPQLADPDLTRAVEAALAASGLDPELLILELGERVLPHDRDRTEAVLGALARTGVRVGIDDFGTGPMSLVSLSTLPVHSVSIGPAFVGGLGRDPADSEVVSAVVRLGHALGLTVTARGIETAAQLSELREIGCDLGQGSYFARPQPAEVVRALVHRRLQWRGVDRAS